MSAPRHHFSLVMLAALGAALALSVIAGVIGLVMGGYIWATEGSAAIGSAVQTGLLGGLVIFASYFAAALVGGLAYFLLQRWTDRWWGRAVTSGILGFIVYGTVGLSAALAYVHLDINLVNFDSHEDAWSDVVPFSVILGAMTALVGPFMLWQDSD